MVVIAPVVGVGDFFSFFFFWFALSCSFEKLWRNLTAYLQRLLRCCGSSRGGGLGFDL